VHTIIEAQSSRRLRDAYESADMVAMDGAPLVAVSRFRGRPGERVAGPDVLLKLCDVGRQAGLRHYFLGGQPSVPASLASTLQDRYPGLIVAGYESPPFRRVTPEEDAAQIARINDARADILWVGLGAPKQEFWAADHQDRLTVRIILPVGAAFDFYSGRIRRAPRWMKRIGLEWLFRMFADPRRLVRRYAVTNTKFVWAILRDELGRRRMKR
jgi:N-acetylglucosaminyldiphosphoundecaprenol N-acetyl-beta-D-mannosaminyltransferase